MELYDNQGSSTPLTAKEKKAQPERAKQKKKTAQACLKAVFIFLHYLPHGRWAFSTLKHPPLGNASLCEAIPSHLSLELTL